jgi:hypothetical protein
VRERHLTLHEQTIMHRALRRGLKIMHQGKCTVELNQIYDHELDDFRDVTQADWDRCYALASGNWTKLAKIADLVKGITPYSEIK